MRSAAMPAPRPMRAISAAASSPPMTRPVANIIRLNDPEIDRRLKSGPDLVSANFVIPYPPGFPIMVPGQVITQETIDFMRKLDVKEIHGYDAKRGPEAGAARRRLAKIGGAGRPALRRSQSCGCEIVKGDGQCRAFSHSCSRIHICCCSSSSGSRSGSDAPASRVTASAWSPAPSWSARACRCGLRPMA